MTKDEMDGPPSRRVAGAALVLGSLGSLGAGALGLVLTTWAMRQWPGWQVADVAVGLGFLSTSAAAAASGWIAALLARAVLYLLADGGGPAGRCARSASAPGSSTRRGSSPAVRQVATGLLAIGTLLATPVVAGATEPVVATRATTHAAGGGGAGSPAVPEPYATGEVQVEDRAREQLDRHAASQTEAAADAGSSLPRPGWTPTSLAPKQRPSTDVGLVSAGARDDEPVDHVVVHRGDTLWDITARHLGEQATDQDVAEQWPLWYAANRDVIGDDPHLLRPGQQLVVPAVEAGR